MLACNLTVRFKNKGQHTELLNSGCHVFDGSKGIAQRLRPQPSRQALKSAVGDYSQRITK